MRSARTYWSIFFILDTSNPCHVVQIYLQIPRGLTTQVNLREYCPNKAYSCVIWQVLNYIWLINQLGHTSISYKSLHTVGSSRKEESSSISAHHSLWLQLSVLSKEGSLDPGSPLSFLLWLPPSLHFVALFSFLILSVCLVEWELASVWPGNV